LAHALWASHQFTDAARVFEALGPFATRLPWAYVSNDPSRPEPAEREFLRARAQSLAAGRQRDGTRPPRGPRPGSGALWPPLPDEAGGYGPPAPPGAPPPEADAAYEDPGAADPYPGAADPYPADAEPYGPYAGGVDGDGPLPHPEAPVSEWDVIDTPAAGTAGEAVAGVPRRAQPGSPPAPRPGPDAGAGAAPGAPDAGIVGAAPAGPVPWAPPASHAP
jgi:hypothetical protein